MANLFKDVGLSSKQLENIVADLLSCLGRVDTLDLPHFVNQLLLISTKGQKSAIVAGILDHFNKLDQQCSRMDKEAAAEDEDIQPTQADGGVEKVLLRETEGTVIENINFAAKQDHEIRQAFLDNMKAPGASALTCFNTVLLLSLSTIKRFEVKVFDFLKTLVQYYFEEKVRREESSWNKAVVNLTELPNIEATVCDMLKYSAHGWDNVTPSLINFGMLLMELNSSRGQGSRATDAARDLGQRVLEQCFDHHQDFRSTIISQIVNRIVSADENMISFIALLRLILKKRFYMIEQHIGQVKEVLQYLPFLPPASALALLKAVTPLLKSSKKEAKGFQDHVVLVLRKAMCRHEASARLISVRGFAHLLRETMDPAAIGDSCTQLSQNPDAMDTDNELYVEISAFMRRCMTQQVEIRETLYSELYPIFCKCPGLRDCILDLLAPQLVHIYESGGEWSNPLKLAQCLSQKKAKGATESQIEVQVLEPLPQLICCLQRCVRFEQAAAVAGEGVVDIIFLKKLTDILDGISQKLQGLQPEDIGLEVKGTQASQMTQPEAGKGQRVEVELLLGSCEVLLEYTALGSTKGCGVKAAIQLMERVHKARGAFNKVITGISKSSKGAAGKKRGRPAGDEAGRNISGAEWKWEEAAIPCSIECSADMLCILKEVEDAAANDKHVKHVAVLSLQQHVLTVCRHNLTALRDQGETSLPESTLEALVKTGIQLRCEFDRARERAKAPSPHKSTQKEAGEKGKEKEKKPKEDPHLLRCLECVHLCVDLLAKQDDLSWLARSLDHAACDMDDEEAPRPSAMEQLSAHIGALQGLCEEMITGVAPEAKAGESCVRLMVTICKQLPSGEQHRHSKWCKKMLKSQIGESRKNLVPVLVTGLLSLTRGSPKEMAGGETIANDLLVVWGTNSGDLEASQEEVNFQALNDETAMGSCLSLLDWVEQVMTEVEWMHANMKAELDATASSLDDDGDDAAEQGPQSALSMLQDEVYLRATSILKVLNPIVSCGIPLAKSQGTRLQSIKLTIRAYRLLKVMLQQSIALHRVRKKTAPKKAEVRLLRSSALDMIAYALESLSPAAFEFINFIQDDVNPKTKKVSPELKIVPELVHDVESFDGLVIQASKIMGSTKAGSKGMELLKCMRRTVARNFRIDNKKLEKALEKADEDDNAEEGGQKDGKKDGKKKAKQAAATTSQANAYGPGFSPEPPLAAAQVDESEVY